MKPSLDMLHGRIGTREQDQVLSKDMSQTQARGTAMIRDMNSGQVQGSMAKDVNQGQVREQSQCLTQTSLFGQKRGVPS